MSRTQCNLRLSGALIAVFGVIFAAGAWGALYPPAAFYLNFAHWPCAAAPPDPTLTERLLLATTGGLCRCRSG